MGASSEEQVILGRNGWLFFRETLGDYTGVQRLSENEIARLALLLDTIDAGLRAQGSRLLIAVVPNKASVYPEYMNAAYPRRTAPGNLERIAASVHATWVPLFDVLREHASEGLYFAMDTHWNALGARYAAYDILMALQEECKVEIPLPNPKASYETRVDWKSDLARMLDPYTEVYDAQQYYGDRLPFSYAGRYRSPEDLTIRTKGGVADMTLLVLRDSFTNLLLDDISGAVGDVTYLRAMPLPLKEAEGVDAVLLEIVERRLPELLIAPPDMMAPLTTRPDDLSGAYMTNVHMETEFTKDGARVFGALDDAPSGLTELCVGVSSAGSEVWYKAFPASGREGDGNLGFSAQLDALAKDAEICVYMKGDISVSSGWTRWNSD